MNEIKSNGSNELIESEKESRQLLYEEHIETGLPIQIRELRKQRNLTQKQLAEITGLDQSNISNWEDPNYKYTPKISTLKKLANAFDVPLIVRFGSWEELLELDKNLTPEKVAPQSIAQLQARITELEARERWVEIKDKNDFPKTTGEYVVASYCPFSKMITTNSILTFDVEKGEWLKGEWFDLEILAYYPLPKYYQPFSDKA